MPTPSAIDIQATCRSRAANGGAAAAGRGSTAAGIATAFSLIGAVF
jgi:hypothetical protein